MTTDPAVTTWTETFDSRDDTDGLFHIPVDEEQERRVDAGLSWMTLCGEIRPPARETRDALIVAPDDCVVCAEIEIAGLDTP